MQLRKLLSVASLTSLVGKGRVRALDLDIEDEASIRKAASAVAYKMMSQYHGNETGQIPRKIPESWWEGGAIFMTLIQYWYWTGDTTYNDVTREGMLWQKGRDDFFPRNWSHFLGNDDQMWDESGCGGGMRWQIWPFQAGYTTKNAISNGSLFQLAARLGRYTANDTYIRWAEKGWDWSATTPLLKSDDWTIADTTGMENNCQDHGDQQWTYNYGAYIAGAAYMYNLTNGAPKWRAGIDGLLTTTWSTFFAKDVMSEIWCEQTMTCDRNEDTFKGFLSSWLAFTAIIAPYTASDIVPRLHRSAIGAARQCLDGQSCGRRWHQDDWDGSATMESDMSALSVFSSAMVAFKDGAQPLTLATGATSRSNPDSGGKNDAIPFNKRPVTAGDSAGASFATVLFLAGWLWGLVWVVRGDERIESGSNRASGSKV
ncbi:glycosyl hydrolase family 76-domain-containing protein [Aspergillus falconensis]